MKIIPALATFALVCSTYNIAAAEPQNNTPNDAIRAKYSFIYSKDFQKKLDDKYGNREKETLENMIIKETYPVIGNNAAKIEIEIKDATPNRPTFEQLSGTTGLSFQSFGIGGADLKGTLYDSGGAVIKTVSYNYYSTMDSMTPYKWTWDDADYAISNFAHKLGQ